MNRRYVLKVPFILPTTVHEERKIYDGTSAEYLERDSVGEHVTRKLMYSFTL